MDWKTAATCAAVCFAAHHAAAQEAKPLLGVPFGQPLHLGRCPFNTDSVKVPCWLGQPFSHPPTRTTSGPVYLPGADRRPQWAAYAAFEVVLDRSKRVQELRVHTSTPNRQAIADSISLRFGRPGVSELTRPDVGWAQWASPEGTASMRCSDECWVTFRTPSAQAKADAEAEAREKKEQVRPKAP